MATQLPLVISSGQIQQLPSGDTVDASKIALPSVGVVAGGVTADKYFTAVGSSGVRDGTQTYVQLGSSSIKLTVLAGEGFLRTSNNQQADLKFISWPQYTDIYTFSAPAAGQETAIFLGVEYNGGTPRAFVTSSFTNFNGHDNFWLARASYDGTTVRILNTYAHAEDTANLVRQWLRLNFPFERESLPEGSGGLELSSSLRALAVTAGKVWHGLNRYSISAIASGSAFDIHYRRAGGGFNTTTGVTSWPNTQYDDGSGTLVTLTNNRYGTLWVYLDIADGSLDLVYGAVNATSVAAAQTDTAPSIPAHLQYHGRLIGRIIFQKSAASATLVESAWTSTFSVSTVGDHSLLSNLQGGTAGEYYHLTAAEYASMGGGGVTTSTNVISSSTTISVNTSYMVASYLQISHDFRLRGNLRVTG